MTSGGGGSQKNRRKEQNQLICDRDKREGGPKNPEILRTSYMEAPYDKTAENVSESTCEGELILFFQV